MAEIPSPQAPEAERAVVACLLVEPADTLQLITERGLKTEDFFAPQMAIIFEAGMEALKLGQVPEAMAMARTLQPKGVTFPQLTEIWTSVASCVPLPGWIDLVIDASRRRKLLAALRKAAASIAEGVPTEQIASYANLQIEECKAGGGLSMVTGSSVEDLLKYDTKNDPNTLIGNRWLCKGGSIIFNAQSGVGKSSLNMQLAIGWALADRWEFTKALTFGMQAVRPMKQVIIQAENDIGDQAEVLQSLLLKLGKSWIGEKELEALAERLWIYRDNIHSGMEFLQTVEALIARHKPDIVWIDPLMCYLGDDISDQAVVTNFCNGLNRIGSKTGVLFALIHHVPKPKEGGARTESDLAYSGFGSSALTNWAREVATLTRVKTPAGDPPTFSLTMTKRRMRAGLRAFNGDVTSQIFIRHHKNKYDPSKPLEAPLQVWIECDEPVIEEEENNNKKRRK